MVELTDEQIAQHVQAGDTDLFGEIIERYEPKLRRYARRFLNQQADIDDMVQDVFIKSYTNIQSFDNTLRFSPWIYRIAHNTFINEIKRKQRFVFDQFEIDTLLPQLPAKEQADDVALSNELREMMDTLLDTLSTKYKEVLILHYYEDLSYKEISDIMRIPITTVGVRISRARAQLKNLRPKTSI